MERQHLKLDAAGLPTRLGAHEPAEVCLEPMAAPTNALGAGACPPVEPGGAFTAHFALRVQEA